MIYFINMPWHRLVQYNHKDPIVQIIEALGCKYNCYMTVSNIICINTLILLYMQYLFSHFGNSIHICSISMEVPDNIKVAIQGS